MKHWWLMLLLLWMAGCATDTPDKTAERAKAIAGLTGTPEAGKPLYEKHCQSCHGADGKGTKTGSDLVGHLDHHGDQDFAKTILKGDGTMPAFADQLTDQQVADILTYLRKSLGN